MVLYKFTATVWRWNGGKACWYFATIPAGMSNKIKAQNIRTKGWGMVPVVVKVEQLQWKTSIFPDSKTKCYLLPIKAEIRKRANITEGNKVDISVEICI